MSAELAMFQAQTVEYKQEIEKLNQELAETKRKYFAYKKREFDEMTKRNEEHFAQNGFMRPSSKTGTGARFVGGGFAL